MEERIAKALERIATTLESIDKKIGKTLVDSKFIKSIDGQDTIIGKLEEVRKAVNGLLPK